MVEILNNHLGLGYEDCDYCQKVLELDTEDFESELICTCVNFCDVAEKRRENNLFS